MTETESKTPDEDAFALLVALLRDRLSEALGRAVQAQVSILAGNIEAAIGSLAGLDVDLTDAIALQRTAILLRRSQRHISRSTPLD